MKEKVKVPGDHRVVSDPIPERLDFVKNITKEGNKKTNKESENGAGRSKKN